MVLYQRKCKILWSLSIKHLWTLSSKWITFTDIAFKTRILTMQPFDLSFSRGFLALQICWGTKLYAYDTSICYNETNKTLEYSKKTSSFVFSCIAILSLDSVSFILVFAFSRSFLRVSFSLATEDDVKHATSFSRVWI